MNSFVSVELVGQRKRKRENYVAQVSYTQHCIAVKLNLDLMFTLATGQTAKTVLHNKINCRTVYAVKMRQPPRAFVIFVIPTKYCVQSALLKASMVWKGCFSQISFLQYHSCMIHIQRLHFYSELF
jgi:hypothetical protein